jgi:hypothetical protein
MDIKRLNGSLTFLVYMVLLLNKSIYDDGVAMSRGQWVTKGGQYSSEGKWLVGTRGPSERYPRCTWKHIGCEV